MNTKNRWLVYFALALALLLLCACARVEKTPDAGQPEQTDEPGGEQSTPSVDPEPDPEPEPDILLTITAAGDDLLHNTLSFDSALAGGGYDFTHLYVPVKQYIEGSDIAFINQEVMLTGEVSAYPRLAAPAEAADALKTTGFNVVNLATNHSMDKGVSGLEACMENVAARHFDAVLGVHDTQEDADTPVIIEKQGVKIGFLSYTYDLNGFSLPEERQYMVDLIDDGKITADLARIRPLCDYLVVSMHWGVEYQLEPSAEQRRLGQLLCDGGADLIIGTHPHVLEPAEWLTGVDGHQTLCVWSLGNFISGQHKINTMLGGLLQMTVRFSPEHSLIGVDSWGVAPVVTHYKDKGGYAVYALADYTDTLAAEHGIKNYDQAMSLDYMNELAQTVLGDALIQPVVRNAN